MTILSEANPGFYDGVVLCGDRGARVYLGVWRALPSGYPGAKLASFQRIGHTFG